MAPLNGWISSGQWWSQSQSMGEQLLQEERREVHRFSVGLPRSFTAVYFL